MLIELALGYPQWLVRAIGHPVMWIGSLIAFLDRRLNRESMGQGARRVAGVAALALVVGLPASLALALEAWFAGTALGLVVLATVASSLVAQRSLARHVADVAEALESGGVAGGRIAVSRIVGRDPDRLDEAGVSRAAIESLAENFSDGVVAPAFWLTVGGLAGGVAYKAANTADSMIGHRSPRHQSFGWAAARFDDLINLPASRLAALLIIAGACLTPGADWRNAVRAVWRDARKHRSPNAGWPEAAMAGALGLSLAGPRVYGGILVADAQMGAGGRRDARAADIRRALRIYWMADGVMVGLVGIVAALTIGLI